MNNYILHANDSLLMVVDIQERLYAAMEPGFRETFVKNSTILIKTAQAFDMPLVVSEQYPKGLGATIDKIASLTGEVKRFEKMHFSCYRDPAIQTHVDALSRKNVIVIGIEAHVCVYQTVIDLLMAGYRVVVADDAVCSRRQHDRVTALNRMAEAGALVYTTEMTAFALLEKAGTAEFKQVSPLFR